MKTRPRMTLLLAALLTTACAAPEPASAPPNAGLENPRLSAAGAVREGPDAACAAEAVQFDQAIARRTSSDATIAAFDAVADCRRLAGQRLVAEHERGRLGAGPAGAALIALRGAMRRDADRLRTAMMGRPGSDALQTRLAQVDSLQDVQLSDGG